MVRGKKVDEAVYFLPIVGAGAGKRTAVFDLDADGG